MRWELTLANVTLARYRADLALPSPAVLDGTALLVGFEGQLHSVGLDGRTRWTAKTYGGGRIFAFATDDALAGSLNSFGYMELFDANGKPSANVGGMGADGITGNPALGHGGLFCVPGSGELWIFGGPPLRSRWRHADQFRRRWYGTAVGVDDTVYATSDRGLGAFRDDGDPRWEVDVGLPRSGPAIGADGTLYIGGRRGQLHALQPDGRTSWTYDAKSPIFAPPVISASGMIYVGSDDGRFHALSLLGGPRWTFDGGGPIHSAAAVARDGTVYVGTNGGRLYALTPEGAEKWHLEVPGAVSSPTLLLDGTVVFMTGDGVLRAVSDPGTGGLDGGAWPKWAGDLRNTARAPRTNALAGER